MAHRALVGVALACFLLGTTAHNVRAQDVPSTAADALVRGEVLVILATPQLPGVSERVIDPRLAGMAALRQPPFNTFGTLTVLASHPIELRGEAPRVLTLPNGRQLRIEVEGTTDDGRYRVRVAINRPGQSDYLPLLSVVTSAGDPFFVAGQSFGAGTLIIATTLGGAGGTAAAAAAPAR